MMGIPQNLEEAVEAEPESMLDRSLSRRPRAPTSKNFPCEARFSSHTRPKKTKLIPGSRLTLVHNKH